MRPVLSSFWRNTPPWLSWHGPTQRVSNLWVTHPTPEAAGKCLSGGRSSAAQRAHATSYLERWMVYGNRPNVPLSEDVLGHEPEQVCDKEFSFNTNLGHSKCTTKKGEVYVCDYSDCPGKGKPRFRFVDCLPIDETTHLPNPTAGKMNIYPYEYSTVDYFETINLSVKNTEYLTCTYCLKSASTPTPL
ncbi:hypothetical protein PGT21_003879 [Puccinia graminis f. sp. tritici]|uniref:Uncharacterized protein n=1 Tax=Puccinia graminis f. sp. tritici TaxID=56615 RepID=A0A5B0PP66_PUCGR|nr:hypothetical protein PGT21_003879 [Puccinia graminis f. sp. tritici]